MDWYNYETSCCNKPTPLYWKKEADDLPPPPRLSSNYNASRLFRSRPKFHYSIGEAVEFESLYLALNESILRGAFKMKIFYPPFPALKKANNWTSTNEHQRASNMNSEQGKASVLPSQLRPSTFSLYPSRQSQKNEAGILTQSCSQSFDDLFWHSSMSEKKKLVGE